MIEEPADPQASRSRLYLLSILLFVLLSVAFPLESLSCLRSARVFEVVVPRLNHANLLQTVRRQGWLQNIPNHFDEIFSRGGELGKGGITIEVEMIEALDDLLIDDLIEPIKIARILCYPARNRDQHDIIVPMPVWIITFAERGPILFGRELIRVEPMGGAKTIAPGHMHL